MSYNSNFEIPQIPKEKLEFVQRDKNIHDAKFENKPVGYFLDAWYRFRKNKSSIVAAIVILVLMIYAVLAPMISRYDFTFVDPYYSYTLPKCGLFEKMGFWDGCEKVVINQALYDYYSGIPGAIKEVKKVEQMEDKRKGKEGKMVTNYTVIIDTYKKIGYKEKTFNKAEYEALKKYEEETGIQIFVPHIDVDNVPAFHLKNDTNVWFLCDRKGVAERDAEGNLVPNFLKDENGNPVYVKHPNPQQYNVRIDYREYFKYVNGDYPSFLFGADNYGMDIWVRLAGGARLSFLLGIFVASANIIIGVIVGALEGYYGGAFDLFFERFKDILGSLPTIVTATLFNLHLAPKVGPLVSLFFAFILTGWLGVSGRTRTQFYRFKGQEYVLAARTLGAKDGRLIFKHILPNAIGTLVTSTVLMVPGVIFSESSLSYLGIINLNGRSMTSIGTLLSQGQAVLSTHPHIILYPALFISLLEVSFNLFGNGLRDALNPSLRGAE